MRLHFILLFGAYKFIWVYVRIIDRKYRKKSEVLASAKFSPNEPNNNKQFTQTREKKIILSEMSWYFIGQNNVEQWPSTRDATSTQKFSEQMDREALEMTNKWER